MDERLAAGGMGEVWKGFDTRLSRPVAIKILHAGLSSNDKFRARFQLEARAVAALQSPGIVALYDYGEETGDDGEVSYLVMELVRGRSLAEILQERGKLTPPEVMRIVATSADALETAHRADIIHRDIKPANLLVDEDEGTVKIVDFGIASARGASGLTETGTVMGTLAYASPEQLNGAELTGATDLYSLGIVAYEMLMGRAPFVSDTPVAVMNGHMTQAPPPLSRDIPPGIAQVVLQALQKDPSARYTSAAEMARSAREGRIVTGGIPAGPPSTPPGGSTQLIGAGAAPMLGAGANTPTSITAAQPTGPIEPDEEKKHRAVPWMITVGVTLAVALILVVILGPWNDNPDVRVDTGDESSTPAETDSPSPTEEETTEEAPTNWDNGNNNDNDEPTTEEPTSESPSPSPSESESPDPEPTTSEPEPEPTDTEPEPTEPEPEPTITEGGGDEAEDGQG
ncbi:serine/threonine protein kinase [Glycomyces sp. L485]|uniref:serine/threonine-protein kinase n=1 Tax=Glycomyces sp. L485 TaxID=2909235 RepID=UPI001F4B1E62|nr:serine/threonine-protein kinase [Glycomyces sp. L485]MCH7231817.1 serine/threonine protein kinase [Glycomyces sp. L485]